MFTTLGAVALLAVGMAAGASMLHNGDFERGLVGWSTNHAWYERPAGAGLSEVVIAEDEGRDGGAALKIIGGGKRGIAMQSHRGYPGRYRVTGWIRCENLQPGRAGVLMEWIDRDNEWMSGDWAVEVSGDQDWMAFDTVLEAPHRTRSIRFFLLTSDPNDGTVWFDDITLERLPSDLPTPVAPVIRAETPEGHDGCLEVTWAPDALGEGVVRVMVYCEPVPEFDEALPRAVFDAEEGRGMIWSVENGVERHLAAVAVNADGDASAPGPVTQAVAADRQAPRPGRLEAQRTGEGASVEVSWSPHGLDYDVRAVHLVARAGEGQAPVELRTVDARALRDVPRPFYSTAPWVAETLDLPAGMTQVGAWRQDEAGNRGETAWVDIAPAPSQAEAPCDLWTAPPTEQLPHDAVMPEEAGETFALTLLRGQAKGFQVMVRPREELPGARVRFDDLVHENGADRIESGWLAAHFVNYVDIELNSRATPPEELLWPAPAPYPDELSDDRSRDLPADLLQPIYIRVTAPREAAPGAYRGRGRVESAAGVRPFEFSVTVAPLALPERPQLQFVYWFSWGGPCREFGVEQYSEDGWRVLSRLGELMTAHHQNVVVVPWSLVRSWRDDEGALRHDFADFDRFVRTFQAAGVDRLFCVSHIGSRTTGEWLCPTMDSHRHRVRSMTTGEEERIDVIELLPALERHIDRLGLLDSFSIHVADEPIPVNLESYRELSERVRQAAPRLRRIDAVHVPDLVGALEIWVPQLNYLERWLDEYRAAQQAGNEIWFYVAWVPQGKYPNRMIDSHAIKSRVLHWMNALYDTTGYLHWALNHWHHPLTSLQSPGDQYICWPSRHFVANSSLRYEAEREGLEDCELMFMLRDALVEGGLTREQAQAEMESVGRRAVREFQDYTRSWEELEQVRLEMMRRLVAEQR